MTSGGCLVAKLDDALFSLGDFEFACWIKGTSGDGLEFDKGVCEVRVICLARGRVCLASLVLVTIERLG